MNIIIQCTALQSYASYKIEPLMDVIAHTVYIENSILLHNAQDIDLKSYDRIHASLLQNTITCFCI